MPILINFLLSVVYASLFLTAMYFLKEMPDDPNRHSVAVALAVGVAVSLTHLMLSDRIVPKEKQ